MSDLFRDARFLSAYKLPCSTSGSYSIPTTHLIYKISGRSRHLQGDLSFTSSAGDILLIPKGASFRVEILEPGEYYILYFDLPLAIPETIRHFPAGRTEELRRAFSSAASLYSKEDPAAWYRCQGQLFEIFGLLETRLQVLALPHAKRQILVQSIAYLREHLYDPELSLSHMYELSGISDTAFRALFTEQFGLPPKRYVIRARMKRAADLLRSDPLLRVEEVAYAVGYTDVFHFSKMFKAECGVSPSGVR